MYRLIYKDIRLLINYFIVAMPISIFFVIVFTRVYPGFGYAMGAFGIAAMFVIAIPSMEARNHSETIINSLPVLRTEIVRAKYLVAFLYAASGLLMMASAGWLVNISPLPFNLPYMNWKSVIITLILVSILISIYYPLFYRFYNQVVIFLINIVLFQLLFFFPSFISDYMNGHIDNSLVQQLLQLYLYTPWSLPLLGITSACLFLVVSYLFTIKIYTAKDF